jgi:hypothetical protein
MDHDCASGVEEMDRTRVLTRHQDIRAWVTAHKGMPAIRRIPDRSGTIRQGLALRFAHHRPAPTDTPSQDDGLSPCSWSAWLAELDRQDLALRIDGTPPARFELVRRADLN